MHTTYIARNHYLSINARNHSTHTIYISARNHCTHTTPPKKLLGGGFGPIYTFFVRLVTLNLHKIIFRISPIWVCWGRYPLVFSGRIRHPKEFEEGFVRYHTESFMSVHVLIVWGWFWHVCIRFFAHYISWNTFTWVMSHTSMSHVICEWVMSHIWMRHVKYMNESCHTQRWGVSHI